MTEPQLSPGYELADVLIMVKTYPAPSKNHGETVCVAGARLDGPDAPSWIRLYPISFRNLENDKQFKKYQRIKVPVQSRGSYDPRPESYRPDVTKIQKGPTYGTNRNWADRRTLIAPLIGARTTCELENLNKAARMNQSVPSLGLVKATIRDVTLEVGEPWTQKQLAKVRAYSAEDLFGEKREELKPVPYQIYIKYKCAEPECREHGAHLIDWELGIAGLKWSERYKDKTGKMILEKYQEILDNDINDVHLIIGNQHQHRKTFSVCGIWYPKLPSPTARGRKTRHQYGEALW